MHTFDRGTFCPMRVRSIEEQLFRGDIIFRYSLTPSHYQGQLLREEVGDDEDLPAFNCAEFTFASRHRLANLGVGDYFLMDLIPHEVLPTPAPPAAEPGTALTGLIQSLFPDLFKPAAEHAEPAAESASEPDPYEGQHASVEDLERAFDEGEAAYMKLWANRQTARTDANILSAREQASRDHHPSVQRPTEMTNTEQALFERRRGDLK